MSNPTELAQKEQTPLQVINEHLRKASKSIKAVAAKHITPERVTKIVVGAVMRNPQLLECDPASIVRSVLQGVELGLEPGSALNQGYLVPFWNNKLQRLECQFQPSYMGLAELAYRSGIVRSIRYNAVYKGEHFVYSDGAALVLEHIPGENTADADITHAYCVIDLINGGQVAKVLTRGQIDRLRLMNQAVKNKRATPWDNHFAAMAIAKAIKQALKIAPKSVELAKAIKQDDAIECQDWSDVEYDIPEANYSEEPEPPKEPTHGSKSLKKRIGNADPHEGESMHIEEPYSGNTVKDEQESLI